MILLLDNYDSFTHNLYQYLRELTDEDVVVIRNDQKTVAELEALEPSRLIISPGPGRPEDAGVSVEAIGHFAGKLPILGVCLGHQAIAHAFGGQVVQAKRIVHGKAENITNDGKGLFRSIGSPAQFTRYHSLAVAEDSIPHGFEISARSDDGEIMGIRHRELIIEGVQFHPESIASEGGKKLLHNFLNYRREAFVARSLLDQLQRGEDLSQEQAENFMEELTDGNLSDAIIAGVLMGISVKGPAASEIAGCAQVLRRKHRPFTSTVDVVDTCGTGGDGLNTINISSLTALTTSALGLPTAKHGNRAVTSKSGSSQFYEALGIRLDLSPDQSQELLAQTNFAFLYAPTYHSAMRFAAPVRKELKVKTIMNLVGPLSNPAHAAYQVIGVYDSGLTMIMAKAAALLGVKAGMVVHGSDGQDEISVCGTTQVVEFSQDGSLEEYIFDPSTLGIPPYRIEDLMGGDAQENARIAREMLAGRGYDAIRHSVALNAGATLKVCGRVASIGDGYGLAMEALESGLVLSHLDEICRVNGELQ